MSKLSKKWRLAIDRGGTFTDIVALDTSGIYHSLKLLSYSSQYKDASIEGIKRVFGLTSDQPLPEDKIEGIRFGTTIATNALLEQKGGKTALLITKGFADLLFIGYQNRPHIFKLCIERTPPLYSLVIEVDERIDSHGKIVNELQAESLLTEIEKIKHEGFDAIAVVFMHSWKNPLHELLCEQILREQGFKKIILSHKSINAVKIVSRGQSTLIDAYLSTVLANYLEQIEKELRTIPIEFMQSNGVLSIPSEFSGKHALFSGPAGGVSAVARIAEEVGIGSVIGFDMGGTSTDVSRFDGQFERRYEQVINGLPIQMEMLNIITVAAGGGSILKFDGCRMMTGPESAGSYPGPACYGFGGPLTITDANLLTGRLIPEYFPRTFGPNMCKSIDIDIVKEKFLILTNEINAALKTDYSSREVAAGLLRIANEKMAMAIKEISVSKGFDVREYALVCFGGAGGQHACSISSLLGIEKIIIHPLGSLLSAYGIGLAESAWKDEKTVLMTYSEKTQEVLDAIFSEMEENLYRRENLLSVMCSSKRELDIRPRGAETFITVKHEPYHNAIGNFKRQYKRLFGFIPEDTDLEIVNVRIDIKKQSEFFTPYDERRGIPKQTVKTVPASYQEIFYQTGCLKVPIYPRESIAPFMKISGPAFIVDTNTTVVVDPEFEVERDKKGLIFMTRRDVRKESISQPNKKPDPVLLEIFNNIFMNVATEMGIVLKNTAHSVNMKERLDFSCAIFDKKGNLVANAPHIPVHLGAMADSVKTLLKEKENDLRPGDMYLTNDPYHGGSHLPDITVICPVFSEEGSLIFFTASRGHHADIGGKTPGSMPPLASHIDEEGVLIDNHIVVRDGSFREGALRDLLTDQPYPVRNIDERIADLRAQVASCNKGMKELLRVISRYGIPFVTDYMTHIQDNAEYSVKKALYRFIEKENRFHSTFEDYLDDGTPIKVALALHGGENPPGTVRATIDFTGTGSQHLRDNLNAPISVTHSAVIYVLRTLLETDIPLNSGCLRPITIIVPAETLLNPAYPLPVASGNVETSQRIVDVLLGAFGIAAASQGTMNNLIFEVEGETPYYETIAGGSGALEGCPGASGVQVHMTNTMITDPEILEFRHPGIRLKQFILRENSGGKGRYQGGDGVIREMQFLKPASVSILSERRVYAAYGMKGGCPGKRGFNFHKKADGGIIPLGHREVLKIETGDSVIIETPGGGGYGQP